MTIDIELWTEQFLAIAREMDAVAAELHTQEQNELAACMRAFSFRLRNVSSGVAADVVCEITSYDEKCEALSAGERQFRSLAENLPDNIARWNRAGHYLYLNPPHARTLGRPVEEVIGTHAFAAYAQVVAGIEHVITTGEALTFVRQEAFDESGARRVYDVSLIPEKDAEGAIVSVLGIGRDMTGPVVMEEALTASERQFRSLAENLPNYLARHALDARYAYLNRMLETLTGCRAQELTGRLPSEIFRNGGLNTYSYECAIREVARTGSEQWLDLSVMGAEGHQRLHHIHIVPERDEAGVVTSVLCIGFDVTAQRRSEAKQKAQHITILELNSLLEDKARQLDETRARLHTVLQTLPDMVWMKDTDGIYLSCNHAFERLAGRTEREILGKTDHQLFDADLASAFHKQDLVATEAGRVCINDEWVTYPDSNQMALLETRKVPVLDTQGNVTGVLGVARDVTEHRRIDEALASREHEFRTLVEHSPDIVIRYGRDLRRRYVNPTFVALIGITENSLIGKKPCEYQGGTNSLVYEQKLAEVFSTGKDLEFESRWTLEDGTELCHLFSLTQELDADGRVDSVLAVGRDITELYASREKIRQMAY